MCKKQSVLPLLFLILVFTSCSTPPQPSPTPEPTVTLPPTATNTPTPTATSTPTMTPTITPTITPTQIGGGSGKVLFRYTYQGYEDIFPELEGLGNIFLSNYDGTDLIPLTNGLRGFNHIEAVSPDGSKVLVSSFSTNQRKNDSRGILYLIDLDKPGSEPIELVQGFSQYADNPASGWVNESRIVYIGKGDKGYGLYATNLDGSDTMRIDAASNNIPEKILSVDAERVYWQKDVHKNYGVRWGDYNAVWWTSIDGSEQGKLETNGRQVEYYLWALDFSPDGKRVAWVPSWPEPECNTIAKMQAIGHDPEYDYNFVATCELLYVADLADMDNPIKIPLIPPRDNMPDNYCNMGQYSLHWSSTNKELFLLFSSNWCLGVEMFYVDMREPRPIFDWINNFPALKTEGFPYLENFSPDGKRVFMRKVIGIGESSLYLIDLENMAIENSFLQALNRDWVFNVHILP